MYVQGNNSNLAATPLAAVVNKQDANCDTVATGSALAFIFPPATPSNPVHPAAAGAGSALLPSLPHPDAAPKTLTGELREGAGAAPNGGPITNFPPPQKPCKLKPNGERLRDLEHYFYDFIDLLHDNSTPLLALVPKIILILLLWPVYTVETDYTPISAMHEVSHALEDDYDAARGEAEESFPHLPAAELDTLTEASSECSDRPRALALLWACGQLVSEAGRVRPCSAAQARVIATEASSYHGRLEGYRARCKLEAPMIQARAEAAAANAAARAAAEAAEATAKAAKAEAKAAETKRRTRAARRGGGGRTLPATSGVSSPQPRQPPTPQATGGSHSDDEPEVESDDDHGADEWGSGRHMARRPALGSLAVHLAGQRAGAQTSRGPSHAWAPAAARGNDRGGREGSPL